MIKSKLKRRLRKKNHLGEFQEFGFELMVSFKRGTDEVQFDKFWYDFIGEIERNKLLCSGGGSQNSWQVFVMAEKKFTSPTNNDKEKIRNWFENCPSVENYQVGEFLDAWNDPKWNG